MNIIPPRDSSNRRENSFSIDENYFLRIDGWVDRLDRGRRRREGREREREAWRIERENRKSEPGKMDFRGKKGEASWRGQSVRRIFKSFYAFT